MIYRGGKMCKMSCAGSHSLRLKYDYFSKNIAK